MASSSKLIWRRSKPYVHYYQSDGMEMNMNRKGKWKGYIKTARPGNNFLVFFPLVQDLFLFREG
jgi:hypothetical protein